VQIRGHRVRLDLDVFIVATANPEDYTNRGRIITPLKDRYGAQIRTHYPARVDDEIAIVEQEAHVADVEGLQLAVPRFMKEIIVQITHFARRSPDINQRSGVSVRTSIALYEALVANALRRALRTGETEVVPRMSDLPYVLPSFQGKVEFEATEEGQEDRITQRILQAAIKTVFDSHYRIQDAKAVAAAFEGDLTVETAEHAKAADYADIARKLPGIEQFFPDADAATQGVRAAIIELVLEGLHVHKLLNKHEHGGSATYRR
jgi:magnesium chelatase subunit I